MAILEWMEQTRLSIFINESSSLFGFAGFLCVHTLGLSLLAGVNAVVSIRMLGVASTIPLQPLKRLFPYMWVGFILTLLSGAGLAMARATVPFDESNSDHQVDSGRHRHGSHVEYSEEGVQQSGGF